MTGLQIAHQALMKGGISTGITCTEWYNAGPEVVRVEGSVDSGKEDGREAALDLDVSLGLLEILHALVAGNLAEHLLDLVNDELLGKLQFPLAGEYGKVGGGHALARLTFRALR